MSKGGKGAWTKYWNIFLGLLTTLDLFKVVEERTIVKNLIHFQRPTKLSFMLFCCILQNVAIYTRLCYELDMSIWGRIQFLNPFLSASPLCPPPSLKVSLSWFFSLTGTIFLALMFCIDKKVTEIRSFLSTYRVLSIKIVLLYT